MLKNIERKVSFTLSEDQHVFFPGKSTGTSAIDFTHFVHESYESKLQVDVFLMIIQTSLIQLIMVP